MTITSDPTPTSPSDDRSTVIAVTPTPQQTAAPMSPNPDQRSRKAWLVTAAVAVVAVGLGALWFVERGDAADNAERAAAAEAETDDLTEQLLAAERSLTAAETEAADNAEELAGVERQLDRTRSILVDTETSLANAKEDALGELLSEDDLLEHRERVMDVFEAILAADTLADIDVAFVTLDRHINELVGTNVPDEFRECKEIMVNNGYLSSIIVAMGAGAILEDGEDIGPEFRETMVALSEIIDIECGWNLTAQLTG